MEIALCLLKYLLLPSDFLHSILNQTIPSWPMLEVPWCVDGSKYLGSKANIQPTSISYSVPSASVGEGCSLRWLVPNTLRGKVWPFHVFRKFCWYGEVNSANASKRQKSRRESEAVSSQRIIHSVKQQTIRPEPTCPPPPRCLRRCWCWCWCWCWCPWPPPSPVWRSPPAGESTQDTRSLASTIFLVNRL